VGRRLVIPDIPSLDFQLVISSKAGRYPDLTIPHRWRCAPTRRIE
jgi:hypothetical protein